MFPCILTDWSWLSICWRQCFGVFFVNNQHCKEKTVAIFVRPYFSLFRKNKSWSNIWKRLRSCIYSDLFNGWDKKKKSMVYNNLSFLSHIKPLKPKKKSTIAILSLFQFSLQNIKLLLFFFRQNGICCWYLGGWFTSPRLTPWEGRAMKMEALYNAHASFNNVTIYL